MTSDHRTAGPADAPETGGPPRDPRLLGSQRGDGDHLDSVPSMLMSGPFPFVNGLERPLNTRSEGIGIPIQRGQARVLAHADLRLVDGCPVHPRTLGDVGQAEALRSLSAREAAINVRAGRAGGPAARILSAFSYACRSICPLSWRARRLGRRRYRSAIASSRSIRSAIDSLTSRSVGFRGLGMFVPQCL